jgi:hypothetical protein
MRARRLPQFLFLFYPSPPKLFSIDIPIGTEKGKEAPLDYRLSGLGGQIHEEMHVVQAV